MNILQQQQNKLEGQAKQALGAGREDLAREALSRRSTLQTQYADLETALGKLKDQSSWLSSQIAGLS